MIKTFIQIVLIAFAFAQGAIAQQVSSINGNVIDSRSKERLIGANVVIMDTQLGASTDLSGNFVIRNVPPGVYRLRVDYIGYNSVQQTDIIVTASKPAFVNIEMTENVLEGEQVVVTAGYFADEEKVQTSVIGLSREEIRRFPGGFEDVVRTVSTLPGVAINGAGGRNDLLVRGGGPSENLFIINNIEVPNINHFGTQGTSGGSLSFVNLDFVEDVTFSSGGFSAQYGDKMSSVTSLTTVDEHPEQFESKYKISATQYGFNFENPLNENGSIIFSARKSYLDLIFKAAGLPFIPVYTDYNILAHYELSPKDKLFFLGLSAIDEVDRDQSSQENRVSNASRLDNTQYRGITGLSYRRLLDHGYLDLTWNLNLSRYRFKQFDEFENEYFNSEADEWENGFKAQHYWIAGKTLGFRTGLSAKVVENQNTTVFADTIYDRSGNRVPVASLGLVNESIVNVSANRYSYFTEMDWLVNYRLNMNLGLRADYYAFINKSFYMSPRASLKYTLTAQHSLRLSGGIYRQAPSYVWVVNPLNKSLLAMENKMAVLGWDYLIRSDMRLSIEGYFKNYSDLPTGTIPGVSDYIIQTNTGTSYGGREDDFNSFGFYQLVSKAKGRSYGLEFLLQKKFSEIPFYGQISLSFNQGEFTASNGITYPGQYDQRFIMNLSGGYIFNSKWEISAKFRYYTGVPYTPVYRPSANPVNSGQTQNLPDEYLSARLDAGHHLDVRVDRFFNFNNKTLIVFVDIQNVYNYKIPQIPGYDFWEDKIVSEGDIGILPSIGITLEL